MVPVNDIVAWLRKDVGQALYKDTMIAPEVDPRILSRLIKMPKLRTQQINFFYSKK
jgi:hypothetical protein